MIKTVKEVLQINEADNVAVALKDYQAGDTIVIGSKEIRITEDIARGHKIALTSISEGENVLKYGYPIGHAKVPIVPGQWVHTHNTKTNLTGVEEYTFEQKLTPQSF